MKRLILGSVLALFFMNEPAAATCVYQGFPYSEGARICMHRTMFMCRGSRWVKTAERCWERYSTQTSPSQYVSQRLLDVLAQADINVTTCDVMTVEEDRQLVFPDPPHPNPLPSGRGNFQGNDGLP